MAALQLTRREEYLSRARARLRGNKRLAQADKLAKIDASLEALKQFPNAEDLLLINSAADDRADAEYHVAQHSERPEPHLSDE